MRLIYFSISLIITIALILLLDNPIGSIPPIGSFISPQQGFWQNAEKSDQDFSLDLSFPGLHGSSEVYLDERMVPHVFVSDENDAYFIQGYLHARFRLWQMEFQTYAAAGRISELIGPRALNFDREKRRLGMVYAAEKAVASMEKDPVTKAEADSYTAGVNAYITKLKQSELP